MSTSSKRFIKSKLAMVVIANVAATSVALPVLAQPPSESTWDCYLNKLPDKKVGTVKIWWGHTEGDAGWACDNWISACGNGGGCFAKRT